MVVVAGLQNSTQDYSGGTERIGSGLMSSIANPVKTVGPQDARLGLRPILLALVLALCTAGALVGFYELSSDQAISILAAGVVFFVLMRFVISSAPSAALRSRNLVFVLWWVLLGSVEMFSYVTEDAEGGQCGSEQN